MNKYEMLKINTDTYQNNVVEQEYTTTDKWREVLDFIKNNGTTTIGLDLYIRFNNIPHKNYDHRDVDAGIIYDIVNDNQLSNISNISQVTLKSVMQKLKEDDSLFSDTEEDICYE